MASTQRKKNYDLFWNHEFSWRQKKVVDTLLEHGNFILHPNIFKEHTIREIEKDLTKITGKTVKIRTIKDVPFYHFDSSGAQSKEKKKIPCYIAEVKENG